MRDRAIVPPTSDDGAPDRSARASATLAAIPSTITPIRVAIGIAALAAGFLCWRLSRGPVVDSYACESEAPGAVKVLFIGNSHTFVNDLPKMLCRFDRPMTARSVVAGGWTLEAHWNDGHAARALREKKWDFVVLQEASLAVMDAPKRFEEMLGRFSALAKAQGARVLVYELWPRSSQDPMALEQEYERSAATVDAVLVRVGPAWNEARALHPELRLYQDDGNHARSEGTFIAALAFHVAIFHELPARPSPPSGISPDAERDIEHILLPRR